MLVSIQRLARETSRIIDAYRREVERRGASPAEASAAARQLQDRLLGSVLHDVPVEARPAPWTDVVAFFVAVVELQMALGHAPDAVAAVNFMSRSGLLLPDISPSDARSLARRVPVPPTVIYSAFGFAQLLDDRPPALR